MYYDTGMLNFNYLQNLMAADITNMFYMRIYQENIALKEELKRRDMEEKGHSRDPTELSLEEHPSSNKIHSFNSRY